MEIITKLMPPKTRSVFSGPCKQNLVLPQPAWQRRIRGIVLRGNTGRDVAHAQPLLGRQEGAAERPGNHTAHLPDQKSPPSASQTEAICVEEPTAGAFGRATAPRYARTSSRAVVHTSHNEFKPPCDHFMSHF